MSNLPDVTILIPVYNGARYLSEAIDSALCQTYSSFEVLVIDDGSNDGGATEKVAKKYGNRIRYIKKPNGGVGSALNLGIREAKGTWISWLSHDDVYVPEKLALQMAYIKKHPDCKFVFSYYENVNEKGVAESKQYHWKPAPQIPFVRQLLAGNKINGCATLIQKSCFETVGYFNESNRTAQDYEMWLLMAAKYPIYLVDAVVVKRRMHKEMGSVTLSRFNRDEVRNLLSRMDRILPLDVIFADYGKRIYTPQVQAQCHVKLGDIYAKPMHWKLTYHHYWLALQANPSVTNPAWWKVILGPFGHIGYVRNYYYWRLLDIKRRFI